MYTPPLTHSPSLSIPTVQTVYSSSNLSFLIKENVNVEEDDDYVGANVNCDMVNGDINTYLGCTKDDHYHLMHFY